LTTRSDEPISKRSANTTRLRLLKDGAKADAHERNGVLPRVGYALFQ
jgi:hypothetical protein